jgi:5-formyltetrahydrofolate cyclo-ligase
MPHQTPVSGQPKSALRAHFRATRRALSPHEREQFSARIVSRFLRWLDAQEALPNTLALYLAAPHEASLDTLIEPLRERGVRVVAPRGDGFAQVTAASTCSALDAQTWRSADGAAVEVDEIDMALLPGVAFGHDGSRLGQGGGWYDRALQSSGAILVGVCFSCQLSDTLPIEKHDVVMQWIVCEESMERVGT